MRFSTMVRGDSHSNEVALYLKKKCIDLGWTYCEDEPELIVCVGGDGTLLRGIHQYLPILDRVSFVGIHTGTLGFYTDYTQDELDLFLKDIQKNNPQYEEMPLLEMPYGNETIYALNEIRIESVAKTISLDVYIDGEYFEHCTGSGICISTQAGSTAINRALQGAVIDNGLQVIQLSEIMPIAHKNHHSLRNPYIMRSDRKIMIQGDSLSLARLCFDHLDRPLTNMDKLYIQTSPIKVRFARYRHYSYLKRLKNLY